MILSRISPTQPIEHHFLLSLPLDHVLSCLDALTDGGPWTEPYGITGPPLTVVTRKADARTYILRLAQTAHRPRQRFPHYDALVECASVPEGTQVVLALGREPQEVWFSALALVFIVPMLCAGSLFSPMVRGLLALAAIACWWVVQRVLVYRVTRHLARRLTGYCTPRAAD